MDTGKSINNSKNLEYDSIIEENIYQAEHTNTIENQDDINYFEKFKIIFDTFSDVLIIVDNNANIKYASASIEKIFGYNQNEVLNTNCYYYIHPDDIPNAKELLDLCLNDSLSVESIELRICHKEEIWRFIQIRATNLINNPKVNGIVLTIRDITTIKTKNEELFKSNRRYEAILQAIPDIIFVVSKNGIILEINTDIDDDFCYQKEKIIGKNIEEIGFKADNYHRLLTQIKESIKTESILIEEYKFNLPNNKNWYETRVISLNKNEVLVILRRITETKNIDDQLRTSEKKYRLLVEDAPVGIFRATIEGKYTDINKVYSKMLGYDSPKDALNAIHNIAEQVFIHPEKRNQIIELISRNAALYCFENEYRRKDNTTFVGSLSCKVIREEDGTPNSIFGFVEDITERKITELALKDSEEKFRKIIEQSPIGIVITDENGNIVEWNQEIENITQLNRNSILGQKIWNIQIKMLSPDFINENTLEILRLKILTALETGNVEWLNKYIEFEIPYLDTGKKLINTLFFSIKSQWGYKLCAFVMDVTEQKISQLALQESEHLLRQTVHSKDKFFRIIAHDIRNPLSSFINMFDTIINDFSSLTLNELKHLTILMNESANNLFRLLNNLLEWAKSQTGAIQYNPEEADLWFIAMNEISIMESVANNKGITLINEIQANTTVFCDVKMIQTIIRNLISNAIKYTHTNGIIQIKYSSSEDSHFVSVVDNGIGMSQDNIKKLFKIDEQVKTIGTKGEPSSGIGLILCKEFIDKHNGCFKVESEIGKGSIFTFIIPK